nr:MAG TPA: Chromatin remodeling complex ATPase [Caudoviricetes sp.]
MIKLYQHQIDALDQTKDYKNVAYYFDMGLGKTFIGSEKLISINNNINLLICQKSKINDWIEHFNKYYNLQVFNLTNSKEYESFLKQNDKSVGVINYELAWRRTELSNLRDFTLMLDESSQIKDETAKKSKFILKLRSINNILLSGTPVSGKYEEIWSQCKLLGWDISKYLYYDQFLEIKKIDVGDYKIPIITGYKNIDRLKRKLREYGAIFKKTDEVFELPEQVNQIIKVENTKEYKYFIKHSIIEFDELNLVGDMTLTKMLYSRQLASQYNKNKFNALKDIINSTNDRLVIFYNFNDELKKIKELIKDKKISEINGSIKDLSNFEKYEDSITLIQYTAGAMGLNLQKANKIIYFSLPLSSELMEQSKKRTHRIGQDKTCFYYYLITENSIDERIYKVLEQRKDYTNKLFEEEKHEK